MYIFIYVVYIYIYTDVVYIYIYMEPKNGGLDGDFPFQLGDFKVSC